MVNGHAWKGIAVFSDDCSPAGFIGDDFEVSSSEPNNFAPMARFGHEGIIAAVDRAEFLHLYDFTTRQITGWLKPFRSSITAVAFSKDGDEAIVGGSAGELALWKMNDIKRRTDIKGHRHLLLSVAMDREPHAAFPKDKCAITSLRSITEHQFVSGDERGTVRIWDKTDPTSSRIICKHSNRITGLEVAGPLIISTSYSKFEKDKRGPARFGSGEVKIADIRDLERLVSFNAHNNGIFCVCLSPDGQGFATGGGDGKVIFWDVTRLYRRD